MKDLAALRALITASTFVLTFALHGVAAHLFAIVCARKLVRAPRARSILWKVALLLPVVTAVVATAGWRPVAAIGEVNIPDLAGRPAPGASYNVWMEQRTIRHTSRGAETSSFATDSRALQIAGVVAGLAVLAAMAGLARLAMRRRDFRRRLGLRATIADRDVATGYRVTCSSSLGAPVALGLSEICVPLVSFARLTPTERRSVLAHEAAHLSRHDPFWFALGDALVALFPWQPFARIVVRELRREAEFCCDDSVVRGFGDGRALVRSLAVFATAFDPAETALAASCSGSPLEERVRRILAPAPSPPRGTWFALVVGLLVMSSGIAIAVPVVSTRTSESRRPPARPGAHRYTIIVDSQVNVR